MHSVLEIAQAVGLAAARAKGCGPTKKTFRRRMLRGKRCEATADPNMQLAWDEWPQPTPNETHVLQLSLPGKTITITILS